MTPCGDHVPPMPPQTAALRDAPPRDLPGWNRQLNRTHAMAAMRARAGFVVTSIEARRRRLVAARVRRLRPRVVVDAGCEDGWIAEGYADAVERLVLLDVDPRVLADAPLASRPGVRAAVADATDAAAVRVALEGIRADIVVLSALLEHLPRPADAIAALRGALRPGGRFVVYLPADGPILVAKALLRASGLGGLVRGLSLDPAPGHLHRFARRDVKRLLASAGAIEELTFDPVCLGYVAVARSD
jgi:SAM-dependent methyltransferase